MILLSLITAAFHLAVRQQWHSVAGQWSAVSVCIHRHSTGAASTVPAAVETGTLLSHWRRRRFPGHSGTLSTWS